MRKCSKCDQTLPVEEFYTSTAGYLYAFCKACHMARCNAGKREEPAVRLLASTRSGAYSRKLVHAITKNDIPLPTHCKYLGIELDYRPAHIGGGDDTRWKAASVDRIDSSLGYLPDNIQVISGLANKMKQNATLEQLVAFAVGVLKTHAPELLIDP